MVHARFWRLFIALFLLSALSVGCGGSSGGGGPSTGASLPSGQGISLLAITFPEYTDLSGGGVEPPQAAPLSQQVVLTFSGAVQGPIVFSAIQIYASPGLNYNGPTVAVDLTKNIIPGKGTLEVMNNIVVFTPFIPTQEIDLTPNAKPEAVPGLLPGYTYRVFVPIGTQGSIPNLMSIDPAVTNPVEFNTIDSPSMHFNFRNQPALPPMVTSTSPLDGRVDFPVNTFSPITGFPPHEEITLAFDQPLDFSFNNLEGIDQDGDGVREQNLFLKYSSAALYSAVDRHSIQMGFLARIDETLEFVGYTNYEDENIGLNSVVFTSPARMVGYHDGALYDVPFDADPDTPLVCKLEAKRLLDPPVSVKAMAPASSGKLYAIDEQAETLMRIDTDTGDVESLGALVAGYGTLVDLAVDYRGDLYGLRLTGFQNASIERIDPATLVCTTLVSGLKGDYTGLSFSRSDNVSLYDQSRRSVDRVDLNAPGNISYGPTVDSPLLMEGRTLVFDQRPYELGVTPVLLTNSYHGASIRIEPSGILPMGTWLEIMVRATLTNVSGGSLYANHGTDPLSAEPVARFRVFDPGPDPIEDTFIEEFLDNDMEDGLHEFANASAIWNIQDTDGTLPEYKGLLAGLGLSGGGQLGNFVPIGLNPTVFLDTNYQPLPLYDGSTPDINVPLVVTDGVFHFRKIVIPFNVTVSAQGSNPLVLTATESVTIEGTIEVSGQPGTVDTTFNSAYVPTPGGKGGPGGGRGGMGQPPLPPNFSALTQLQSVPRGERGWGPADLYQIGGDGGESGAKGTDVPWKGSAQDMGSRGAGGGGGSFLQHGHQGYPGWGKYGVDTEGKFVERATWEFWDGSYVYDPGWPGNGIPLEDCVKLNLFTADEEFKPENQAPRHGEAGNLIFSDGNEDNDFIGKAGELNALIGGQGGGGGGSRLDSMNPETINQAAMWNPPLSPSAYDSKGGGGGGGGGAIAIHSLGEIIVGENGRVLACGGKGGGGEVIGHCSYGGGGGGGSGGVIILNSADAITIEHTTGENPTYGVLDVSGGWGADARGNVISGISWTWKEYPDTCELNTDGTLKLEKRGFCTWSRGDGGYGGHGLIQLMVPDPENDLHMIGYQEAGDLLSIQAEVVEVNLLPNFEKNEQKPDTGSDLRDYYSYYNYTAVYDEVSKTYTQVWPKTEECFVDPKDTLSTISSVTYAVSRWIDMGRVMDRTRISGKTPPVFFENDGYHGFRGLTEGPDGWAEVDLINRYVVNGGIEGFNDIVVNAPDVPIANYVPADNEVVVQFQGTDAKVAGSKVPEEMDPNAITPWNDNLASLAGKQFIRYRIRFNVATDGTVGTGNTKPQVNLMRLRMRY